MIQQLNLFDDQPDSFEKWVHSDPGREIANRFIRLAYGLKRRGFGHYGAKGIVERLRWHYELRAQRSGMDFDYKINNNTVSRLARFCMQREPGLVGFFETRKLHGKLHEHV